MLSLIHEIATISQEECNLDRIPLRRYVMSLLFTPEVSLWHFNRPHLALLIVMKVLVFLQDPKYFQPPTFSM